MVQAEWFDGYSSQPQAAHVDIEQDWLVIHLPSRTLRHRLATLEWPEAGRADSRLFYLPDQTSLQAREDAAWQTLAARHRLAEKPISQWQRSGWLVAIGVLLLVAFVAAGLRWGTPLAARAVLALIPVSVDQAIGEQSLAQLDKQFFMPSALSAQTRLSLRTRLSQLVARASPGGTPPAPHRLEFRRSTVGPNAFALPGNTIVLTDELVALADGNDDMVMGVLAHEIGHQQGRHAMRSVTQSLLTSALMAVILGDMNSLLTNAPLLLGSLPYSRELEREADDVSIDILLANDMSPAVMADFFRKIRAGNGLADDARTSLPGLLFSSHPGAEERIRKFEDAAYR